MRVSRCRTCRSVYISVTCRERTLTGFPLPSHRDAVGGVAERSRRERIIPGFEASLWLGLGAPRNTPAAIVDKLNTEINAGLADSKMKQRLADLGSMVLPISPSEFASFIAEDTDKWAKVVKTSGARPD